MHVNNVSHSFIIDFHILSVVTCFYFNKMMIMCLVIVPQAFSRIVIVPQTKLFAIKAPSSLEFISKLYKILISLIEQVNNVIHSFIIDFHILSVVTCFYFNKKMIICLVIVPQAFSCIVLVPQTKLFAIKAPSS